MTTRTQWRTSRWTSPRPLPPLPGVRHGAARPPDQPEGVLLLGGAAEDRLDQVRQSDVDKVLGHRDYVTGQASGVILIPTSGSNIIS